jgi:DNA repair exonuclease SbcCD ATPase subunit
VEAAMADRRSSIQVVRERLTGLLADWGAEMSLVLTELEHTNARLAELETSHVSRDAELEGFEKRVAGQEKLIETLKAEAEDAQKFRKEIREKDLELERVKSELNSKKELVKALRRDAEIVDRLKADSKTKDREIEELRAQIKRAEERIQDQVKELSAVREVAGKVTHESAELEAVRAELEARKVMIKSLRGDQDRVAALEATLEEKREIITQLEASINRHSKTITDLKRSAEAWKRKYQSVKGQSSTAETSVNVPALSDTDVRAIEQIEQIDKVEKTGAAPESTIAIDMRRSLLEARRAKAQGSGEK